MLVNREVILAKIESSYNTDPTLAGTDAILIENVQCQPEGARMAERPAVRSSIGTLRQIFAGTLRTISFDVEIKGSGSAGTAPELGVLLRGCGFDEIVVASTSVTYGPVSTGFESVTLYYYQDGMLTKLTGCRGNVSFNLTAGGIAKASFTFTGHTVTPTDTAIVSPTYDSTVPVPFIGASFSIDSFAAVINSIAFDMGNQLAMPSDANASDGYSEIFIVKRDPNGSFDPEKELVATEAFEANWRSGAEMAMQTGTIGSSAGNRFAFTWPAVSYRNVTDADRDGVRTLDLTFGAAEDTTDDEVSIVFT